MTNELKNKINALKTHIGNTPIVDLGGEIYGKLESENPARSVKDRVAFYMIVDALNSGKLQEGGKIVEATSGNTGIGLAYIARELGLECIIVMPESMSVERRNMISAYGAKLVLTPASEGMAGAVAMAQRIERNEHAYLANQFSNFSCITAHFETTAPEIFSAMPNAKYIISGVGSGGTAMGIKRYIIEKHIDCKVIAVEPQSSPLMSEGWSGAHKIQGIGANFIPKLVDTSYFDQIVTVTDDDAISATIELNKMGCFCGISSGATYSVAKRIRETNNGQIVAILPDSINRYSLTIE